MNAIQRALVACLLLGGARAATDPGPWKVVTFPVEAGIVSSVAIDGGRFAVGLSAGAVKFVDTATGRAMSISDPAFGPNGRILSMSWFDGALWIASEKGLHRFDPVDSVVRESGFVPAGSRAGVKIVKSQTGALWVVGNRKLGRIGTTGRERDRYREWSLPAESEPTSLLKVAGRILVGTANKGLFILDTATDRWVKYGTGEGLSSDQITALEWSGDQVLVGTPEGLDVLDISSLQSRRAASGIAISWMTQVNGAVFASTFDGLVRIDSKTFEQKTVDLPAGLSPEGDLSFAGGVLGVGCGNAFALRQQPTFLGVEPMRPVPEGLGVTIPKALPKPVQLQALLRLPEWPAARIPLGVSVGVDGREVVVKMPADTKGRVQVDFLAVAGNRVIETRSMECDGDRTRPGLVLDPVVPVTNRQELTVSGVASGVGPLALELAPLSQNLSLGPIGEFKQKVKLARGENRMELRLQDGLGNRIQREFVVRFDDKPPQILGLASDSVEGASIRMRVPYRDESEVRVALEPGAKAKASVFDSFVVLEARELALGDNSWKLSFVDEAGNEASAIVRVHRIPTETERTNRAAESAKHKRGSDSVGMARNGSGGAGNCDAIGVIRYPMEPDETVWKVARKFYGTKNLDSLLIRWNGYADSAYLHRMPIGTIIEVPVWSDLKFGSIDPAQAMKTFPWERLPVRKKAVR